MHCDYDGVHISLAVHHRGCGVLDLSVQNGSTTMRLPAAVQQGMGMWEFGKTFCTHMRLAKVRLLTFCFVVLG